MRQLLYLLRVLIVDVMFKKDNKLHETFIPLRDKLVDLTVKDVAREFCEL